MRSRDGPSIERTSPWAQRPWTRATGAWSFCPLEFEPMDAEEMKDAPATAQALTCPLIRANANSFSTIHRGSASNSP